MAETAQPVTMDKIVSLCRRRGFVFPSSEIYGGLGSTYDYGHYGVLMKNNIRVALVPRDGAGARRHRRPRLRDHPQPARLGGVRPRRRLHRPARRLPHVQAPLPRRPARAGELRPQAEQAARRDARLRPHRGAAVQPHVRDAGRRARGRRARPRTSAPRRRRASSSTSRTSSSSRAASRRSASRRSASRSGTRSRPGNFLFRVREFEQMEMEFFVPPAEAHEVVRVLARAAVRLAPQPRPPRREPPRARARRRGALALLERDERHRVPLPDRLAGARGSREPRRLRPHAAHAALGHEARVDRSRRQPLHAARDRAGREHRAHLRRAALRRLPRGGRRRSRARRAPAPSAGRAREGGDPAAHPARRGHGDAGAGAATRSCAATTSSSTTTAARSAGVIGARTK